MIQPKNAGYWFYWLFLYGIATIPAALFGGMMASSYIYVYDHAHRPRMSNQAYMTLLHGGELVAALLSATPGFILVGWSQLKDRLKEREKLQARQLASSQDNTIWPPPPLE
jgi:hypothetical protein